ncbi:alginate lyase family protein [Paenibacillus sp. OK076]|uniref:alginate lyase family protein n=1 Tax=Paenibacillus sp. OK076 TaxID=1884379 RepID=UPI0008C4E692|nr:alginate lyase family protein [Paenibacillus sp. OK076]SEN68699.1 Chitodextrinase [Paenibacillus sp. OK076]
MPQRSTKAKLMSTMLVIIMLLIPAYSVASPETAEAATFTHPGIMHNATDLTRMSANQNTEPWKSALANFKTDSKASSSYAKQGPYSTVCRNDSTSTCTSTNYGNSALENDARAAYYNALLWNVTGTQAYANKAIEILNAWSSTLTSIAGTDAQLAAGDNGIFLANAGELLRYSNSGWAAANITQLENMLTNVFYPHIQSPGDANWGGSAMKSMISIAIFTNNQTMFDSAISNFRTNACASVTRNVMSTGQISESGRDQVHALGGLGNLTVVAEIAWKQGVDLFGDGDNRLLAGSEYWSNYNLGNEPTSWDSTYGRCTMGPWSGINGTGRSATIGWAQNEIIYAHYVTRKGLTAPYTTSYMNGMPATDTDAALLTFAYRLGTTTDSTKPSAPTGLTVKPLSDKVINLSWSPSTDNIAVSGYKIYRNGTIVGYSPTTDYTDAGLTTSTAYNYQVSAYDAKSNTSTTSSTVSATTLSSANAQIPFSSQDIGSVGVAGSYSYSAGTYTIKGAGSDIWDKSDQFRFAYVPLKGDRTITARVASLTNTHSSAKAGVMIRESLFEDASNVYAAMKPGLAVFQNRTAPGAITNSTTSATVSAPYWVRATRSGNTVTTYISANGVTWTQTGSSSISAASTAYVGLAVTSHANTTLTTATFDNVSVQ